MASAANDSSKRRRLLGDASPDAGCLLSDLPNGVLTHVANYLDAPSRLLFAAALTNQIAVESDERNAAIVDNEWTTLDFGDIKKDLAVKLIDRDICAVLLCIDAVNRLKRLKLTNCINITGVGLEPLRGSTIIEQIDLSLVGKHQSPRLSSRPPISRDFVLPILDSIIEREGCSLRHVQFPSVWSEGGKSIQFEQFRIRYNEMLDNRGVGCAKCNTNLPPGDLSWIGERIVQNFTCYECLKHFCITCTNDDGEDVLGHCHNCKKGYCTDCQKSKGCICCDFEYCVDCRDFTDCSGCDSVFCEECIASGSATNVRDVFAMSFAQNMKYRLIAIAVRRVAVITVRRIIIRMRIGLLVIDAATASVTIATRRKAYYTQYKCATVVTRATVVIVGNLLRSKGMILCVKRMKKTRIALDVSN